MSSDATPPPDRPWPCRTRRLTPDEVFEHLRAFCRDMMGLADNVVARSVVPSASVRALDELASDFDWVDFPSYFGLDLDQAWWSRWATPVRTVRELCEDLAGRIELPVWEPITLLDRRCETAGAFLAIRRMLADDGADAGRIGPSSPVAPYLRRHRAVFGRVRLASGGRLPHVEVMNRFAQTFAVLMLVTVMTLFGRGVLGMFGVAEASAWAFALLGALATALSLFVVALRQQASYPADFRQLVYTLLGRTPQRTTTPDPTQ